jgi:mannose-6-phosphate isomerase-like protein (cupin superfamily)
MHISPSEALTRLGNSPNEFLTLFEHGSLSAEVYKPEITDKQKPHERDEIYVIISGKGSFINDAEQVNFKAGDFLFVKAGIDHRFINFTPDFSTWVFFYGPKGGE